MQQGTEEATRWRWGEDYENFITEMTGLKGYMTMRETDDERAARREAQFRAVLWPSYRSP